MHKPRLRRHRETHLLVLEEAGQHAGAGTTTVVVICATLFAGFRSTSFPPTLTELIMLPPRPGKALESPSR